MGLFSSLYLNPKAQGQVDDARAGVINAERSRQAGFDAENTALNTGAQDRYTGFGGQQAVRGQQLGDYFASGGPAPGAIPGGHSPLISGEIAKQNGISQMFGDQQSHALGNLRSFGDVMGGISRLQGRDANSIGQINSFKHGSAGVTGLELENANHAGDSTKFWADLIAGAENIAMAAATGGRMTGPATPVQYGLSPGDMGFVGPKNPNIYGPGY